VRHHVVDPVVGQLVRMRARASGTEAGSPGHPGAEASYPALVKRSIQPSHDVACSQRPWMKMTGACSGMGNLRSEEVDRSIYPLGS
jgi:hypothetical protein